MWAKYLSEVWRHAVSVELSVSSLALQVPCAGKRTAQTIRATEPTARSPLQTATLSVATWLPRLLKEPKPTKLVETQSWLNIRHKRSFG